MMKKKRIPALVSMLCAAALLAACGGGSGSSSSTPASAAPVASSAPASSVAAPASATSSAPAPAGGVLIEKDFGSYTLPEDWSESPELSGEGVFFYLKDGTDLAIPTTNISVAEDSNPYAEDEFQTFAQAIDTQMKQQIAANSGAGVTNYTGDGSYTEQGYPLITITIETQEVTTTQYYIVGDERHVMVHVTNFHDADIPDIGDVAKTIVDSFTWSS